MMFVSSLGEDRFSTEAMTALEEMTRGVALLAQVNFDLVEPFRRLVVMFS